MDQRTHSWIAIRAVALLEQEGTEKNLTSLLKPFVQKASIGAWIPDTTDSKKGGGAVDNHVLKIEPYQGGSQERFVTSKADLINRIGKHRMTAQYIEKDTYLDDSWWSTPFKGDVLRPGQHIPNRISAMSIMLSDLLILGDTVIDNLIPGDLSFAEFLDPNMRTHQEAAAMYFFMMSHFIADISMPCHCDGRALSGYDKGLHKELEKHWSKKVGVGFEKKNLFGSGQQNPGEGSYADTLLGRSKEIDGKFGVTFNSTTIPDLMPSQDVWLETINLCRASFALASIMVPYKEYPYNNLVTEAPFDELFSANQSLLNDLSAVIMHDAVLNTAIIWKHVWNKVSKD
jgi:hypothetical protein